MSACDSGNGGRQKADRPSLIEIAKVTRAPIVTRRIVTGTLEAATAVSIFNEEPGRLIELPLYEGDQVEKDAILARIDDSLLKSELAKATATLKQARLDLQRLKRLVSRQLAPDEELSRAQTAVEQADAEVALLQNRIDRSQIRAPFSGVISQRLKEPGDVLPLYSHVLTLIDNSYLKADIAVSELLIANVVQGQAVTVRIDALGEKQYPATVARVHPTIDPATRQGIIEVKLQPVPEGAQPGQLCRVSIESQSTPRLTIPFPALRHDNTGEFVYRVDEQNLVQKVEIQSGIQLADRVEIIQGLTEGDRVVSKGFIGLRPGTRVTIKGEPDTKNES